MEKDKKDTAKKMIICVVILLAVIGGGFFYRYRGHNQKQEPVAQYKVQAKVQAVKTLDEITGLASGTTVKKEEIDFSSLSKYFTANEIDEDVLNRINGKTYVENDNISLADLRYIKVLHYNFEHNIQVGELIANANLAEDYKDIFQKLFLAEYEIQSIVLLDNYWTGDGVSSDTASIENNNTSAFNYRVVPGTDRLSNHALGYAIDVNPIQNPYVTYNSNQEFAQYYSQMEEYIERDSGRPHMITQDDICYKIFTEHGFTWGGDWHSPKDYQHFEKKR